jgi:hypothetical protein
MVYCNEFRNFVPILHFQKRLNMAGAVAASLWNLANKPPRKQYGFAIHTDGHLWQMVRISRDMKL